MRVLIADDSADFRNLLRAFLKKKEDIEILGEAASGQEAVEKTAKLLPDLIFMDIRMPGMSGLEATRKIKAESASIKIIVLTVFDTPEYRQAAEASGADGYVVKASLLSDLLPAIREAFDPKNYESHHQEVGWKNDRGTGQTGSFLTGRSTLRPASCRCR